MKRIIVLALGLSVLSVTNAFAQTNCDGLPNEARLQEALREAAALNERDKAFQWLERAVEARDWHPGFLGVDPLYDSLRTDARFERLLSRVGLPR